MTADTSAPETGGEEFVVTRTFDAPRDLLWRVWTEAGHLQHWWGPKGFRVLNCTNDLRPGGVFHFGLRAPDGSVMWGKWVYREVRPPERLVFVSAFSDAAANTVRAPFSADWPLEVLSTLTLAEQAGRTTLTMRAVAISLTEAERRTFEAMFGSMQQGWAGTLDQLEAYLARV